MSLFTSHTIDTGKAGPHLLVTAGVHGDEFEPIIAAYRLVEMARQYVTRGKVTIIPIVNESAYLAGRRCGADNLDLARVCPGSEDGTITERVAYHVSEVIQTVNFYVDLHNGGKLFDIMPLAGYMLHPSEAVLTQQRLMAEAFGLPLVWGTEASPGGRTLSVARDAGIPAIYVEFGGGTVVDNQVTEGLLAGCVRLLSHLGHCDNISQIGNKPAHVLEEDEKDSGYLQIKMPSPVPGIFISHVRAGDRVTKETLWGVVLDPLTSTETKIMADRDGLAFFVRVFPVVNKGDSLGGILPVN